MFELKVTLDNLLAVAGLVFVAWQMRDANKQSKLGNRGQATFRDRLINVSGKTGHFDEPHSIPDRATPAWGS